MKSESNSRRSGCQHRTLESVQEINNFLKSADYGNDHLFNVIITGMHVCHIPVIRGNFKEANSWKWPLQSTRFNGQIFHNHNII